MEKYNIIMDNKQLRDFNPVMFGCETCSPGYQYITIRDYYLIHYVADGEGEFYIGENTYPVKARQIFTIKKGQFCSYKASDTNPWTYIWLGFVGELAPRFEELPPVMDYGSGLFMDMLAVKNMNSFQEEYLTSKLFQLYIDLFQNETVSKYTQRVRNFIDYNYMGSISVEELAKSFNLNRRYLSRIFKEQIGFSVQEYLVRTRITKATELLKKGFSVQQTANMVGYTDQFAFSKIYKKYTGVTPLKIKTELQGKPVFR